MLGGDRVIAHRQQSDLVIAIGVAACGAADAGSVIDRGDGRARKYGAGAVGDSSVQVRGYGLCRQNRGSADEQKGNEQVDGGGIELHEYRLTVKIYRSPTMCCSAPQ